MAAIAAPSLLDGSLELRAIRQRDARALERELAVNRRWLQEWEATSPHGAVGFDARASIRSLQAYAREGHGVPFAILCEGEFAGQLNVSSISYGSLSSATIGYWISERFAGRGYTPTAVALATDYCFFELGLHRMEICIRPENAPSLRVVQKLGFRYEGFRRRYIHINGEWRDHFCFALVVEEVPQGVLERWRSGQAPSAAATVPEADLAAARRALDIVRR